MYIAGFESLNGIFPKMEEEFTEFSKFSESNKSLKHELASI